MLLAQPPPALVQRGAREELFMIGPHDGPPVVERAPEVRVGNVVVEGRLEGRDGAVGRFEDDLLAEVGDDALLGDGELPCKCNFDVMLAF
jgi:hypothetical protein